jgi:DNA-directed RNA polymerase subunit omega
MARISSEKAALAVGNRYDLILIASARVRELHKGHKPKLETKHGKTLTALTEIEEGLIGRDYLKKVRDSDTVESKREKFR